LARKGQKAWHLGPVIAVSPEVAEKIFRNLLFLAGPATVFVDVIRDNKIAVNLVASHGFTPERSLTRMYLGANEHPGKPAGIYTISGGEKG
ncbi:MAG: hypothetical protein NC823_02700, partial [Candidatus Omnitrophica bacterium]|nr:hypothetical protein [Candidatus Omnitrophota bacterium]